MTRHDDLGKALHSAVKDTELPMSLSTESILRQASQAERGRSRRRVAGAFLVAVVVAVVGGSVLVPNWREVGRTPPLSTSPYDVCVASDLSVLPSVEGSAYAGRPVTLTLSVMTVSQACTWDVSSEVLVVKITSGNNNSVWLTQDCPDAVPERSVVVPNDRPAQIPVVWSGRRSDEYCGSQTAWAKPGTYRVASAAIGSTPTDVQFTLNRAPSITVTRTPDPSKTP